MKKTFIKLLTISALALSACTGTGSNTSAAGSDIASDTPSSQQPQVEALFEITPDKTSYDVEVGENFTPKFKVKAKNSANDNLAKTLSFEIEGQDDNKLRVTSSGNHNSAVFGEGTSVKLYGKRVGSVTLVATSTADPNSFVRIPITVSKALPTLAKTWEKVNKLTNYTLNISRTPTDTELSEHDWDDETQVPVKKIQVTEDALILQKATVDDNLNATYGPAYSDESGNTLYGLGVGKNSDYVGMITKQNGSFSLGERVIGSDGFITKDDISGFGDNGDANSVLLTTYGNENEAFVLGGLRVVNSSWLSTIEKDYGNIYEVEGVDESTKEQNVNLAYVEVTLWEMIDVNSFIQHLATTTDFISLSESVQTSIRVIGDSEVSIEMRIDDSTTYTVTMSDIGSTTVSGDYIDFLATDAAKTTVPEVENGTIKKFGEYIKSNNYSRDRNFYFDQAGTETGTFTEYYYDNYYFLDAGDEFIKKYNEKVATKPEEYFVRSGIAYIDGKAYEFTYTPANDSDPEKVEISESPMEFKNSTTGQVFTNITKEQFAAQTSSLSVNPIFDPEYGFLHTFQADTSSGTFTSLSATANDLLSYSILGNGMTLEQYASANGVELLYKIISLTFTLDASKDLDSVNVFIGAIPSSESGYVSGIGGQFNFHTEKKNSHHQAIENAIAAKTAA